MNTQTDFVPPPSCAARFQSLVMRRAQIESRLDDIRAQQTPLIDEYQQVCNQIRTILESLAMSQVAVQS